MQVFFGWFFRTLVAAPILAFVTIVVVGALSPVGTFNPQARQSPAAMAKTPIVSVSSAPISSGTATAEFVPAQNGTIAPSSDPQDATVVAGVNTAGTVKVNSLA